MTVGELINILLQYDKDCKVNIFDYDCEEIKAIYLIEDKDKKVILY